MKQQLEIFQYWYFINISGEMANWTTRGDKKMFPSLSLVCIYTGRMWAKKILFERVLPQSGNNFSSLGLSCCETATNFILEKKKIPSSGNFQAFMLRFLSQTHWMKSLKDRFAFLYKFSFFLIVIQTHGTNTQCWTISLALKHTIPAYLYPH